MATNTNREIVNHLEQEFAALLNGLKDLVNSVPIGLIYRTPPAPSIGENILRSAAMVEQTCGGLTANLWDDPFEWTLPETLSTAELIVEYLSEVDHLRQRAFASIHDDTALTKFISVPSGEPCRLIGVLVQTLVSAIDYRGRAFAAANLTGFQDLHH